MKKKLVKIFGIAISLICLSFYSSDTSPYPLSKSSLLWKIEGNNIPEGSYLFGTMHLIEKEYFIFPKMAIGAQYTYGVAIGITGSDTVNGTKLKNKSTNIGVGDVGVASMSLTLHF